MYRMLLHGNKNRFYVLTKISNSNAKKIDLYEYLIIQAYVVSNTSIFVRVMLITNGYKHCNSITVMVVKMYSLLTWIIIFLLNIHYYAITINNTDRFHVF